MILIFTEIDVHKIIENNLGFISGKKGPDGVKVFRFVFKKRTACLP